MKIAIDGPAGAGKSTVARKLADQLGYVYIDTGAMYRALTWKALQKNVDLENEDLLHELAQNLNIHFEKYPSGQKMICDNKDISYEIRLPEVSSVVSKVAACPAVRDVMVAQQKKMAESVSVVMDGRDIGECVLPDAEYKFYLTADIEERVDRRTAELESKGFKTDRSSIREDIFSRDKKDSNRKVGALKVLPDSIVIDTTRMDIEQVVARIIGVIQEGSNVLHNS